MRIQLSELRSIISEEISALNEAAVDEKAAKRNVEKLDTLVKQLPDTFERTKDGLQKLSSKFMSDKIGNKDYAELLNVVAMFGELANQWEKMKADKYRQNLEKIEQKRAAGQPFSTDVKYLEKMIVGDIKDKSKAPGAIKSFFSRFGGEGTYPSDLTPEIVASDMVRTLSSPPGGFPGRKTMSNLAIGIDRGGGLAGGGVGFNEGLRRKLVLSEDLKMLDDAMASFQRLFGKADSNVAPTKTAAEEEDSEALGKLRKMSKEQLGIALAKELSKGEISAKRALGAVLKNMGIETREERNAAAKLIRDIMA